MPQPSMKIDITERGIMAGERLIGGLLGLAVGKQAGGDIAGGLADVARVGVSAAQASDQERPASSAKSEEFFVFTPPSNP